MPQTGHTIVGCLNSTIGCSGSTLCVLYWPCTYGAASFWLAYSLYLLLCSLHADESTYSPPNPTSIAKPADSSFTSTYAGKCSRGCSLPYFDIKCGTSLVVFRSNATADAGARWHAPPESSSQGSHQETCDACHCGNGRHAADLCIQQVDSLSGQTAHRFVVMPLHCSRQQKLWSS